MRRHKTTRWAVPIQGVFSSPLFFYDIEDNVDSKCGGVFHVVPWMVKFMYICIYSWYKHFSFIIYCISIAIIILELH